MAVHFTVTLCCQDCQAVIRYEDERPPWVKPDETDYDEVELRATQFVEQYPVLTRGFFDPWKAPDGTTFETLPALVGWSWLTGRTFVQDRAAESNYVVCPACDGRAYPADAERVAEEVASA